MTPIYLHRLTVTVITTECSPDAIEKMIDESGIDYGMHIDARTDPGNRRRGPAISIADAPAYPADRTDKRAVTAWVTAQDVWRDSWPSVEAFKALELP